MKRRLRAPSPALAIALIALFVALGGTTYAATGLPKNSVGTKQLKKNAVTAPKIKNGAVTASKINTSGLIVPNAVHATSADSAMSATKATNATNATMAASATALNGVHYVVSAEVFNPPNEQKYGEADCPAGMVVAGGGPNGFDGTEQSMNSSFPVKSPPSAPLPNAWGVFMNNVSTTQEFAFTVYAICIHETGAISFARGNPLRK